MTEQDPVSLPVKLVYAMEIALRQISCIKNKFYNVWLWAYVLMWTRILYMLISLQISFSVNLLWMISVTFWLAILKKFVQFWKRCLLPVYGIIEWIQELQH